MTEIASILRIQITENKRIDDAKACVIKYLIDDSDEYVDFSLFIRGIIANKLISNPIHIPIHEYDEIDTNDPIISVIKNINL